MSVNPPPLPPPALVFFCLSTLIFLTLKNLKKDNNFFVTKATDLKTTFFEKSLKNGCTIVQRFRPPSLYRVKEKKRRDYLPQTIIFSPCAMIHMEV